MKCVAVKWFAHVRGAMILVLSGFGLVSLALALNWSNPASARSDLNNPAAMTDSPAYLYQYLPGTASFITLSLPVNSRPAALAVMTGAQTDRIWFTSPDRNRIGQVVYTSTADYTTTEYAVPGRPQAIAASATDVWFTLPWLGQVGHLDVATGVIVTIGLAPISGTLSDLALDSLGQVWVSQGVGDQVNVTALSSTLGVSTTYVISQANLTPGGLTTDRFDGVWVAARDDDLVWHIDPGSGTVDASFSLGDNRQPEQLASDTAGDHIWATLTGANQLARMTLTQTSRAEIYTLPVTNSRPSALALDGLDRVYVVQQANNHLVRLTLAPTVDFEDIGLPRQDATTAAIAVGRDNALWIAASYEPTIHRLSLPLIANNHDPLIPSYGVQNYWALTSQYGLTRIVESKVSWVRFPVSWSSIEPANTTPEHYNWTVPDISLLATKDTQVNLIITLVSNPAWAASSYNGPVNNLADLQEFVGAIVARYPHVKYWEFYNEPDHAAWYGLKGAAYAAMLQAVYPAVKAANPSAQVVMGGLAMDWFIDAGGPFDRNFLPDVLANCAGPCFDVANFHYYPAFRKNWEPYGRDIIGKANYVRQLLETYHYARPIFNTETGWPSATNWGSPELQARYVPKVYVRGLAADLPAMTWFSLVDSDYSLPGLLDGQLTPRPAYEALRALIATMPQPRFVRTIPVSETGSSFIEAYEFAVNGPNGHKRVDVYWYDCPSMVSYPTYPFDCDGVAPLHLSASKVMTIDKLGNRLLVEDADDGHHDDYITRAILSSPIYVEYQP